MVKDQVIAIVATLLGVKPGDVKVDADLEASGFDSMDRVELVMMLEDEFAILLDDEEVEDCKTVADVVAVVERVKGGVK